MYFNSIIRSSGINKTKFPLHWITNKKVRVTASLFKDWFLNYFVPDVREYLRSKQLDFKVLLLIDNAPGHPNILHENVMLTFLPLNTTSLMTTLYEYIELHVKFDFFLTGFSFFAQVKIGPNREFYMKIWCFYTVFFFVCTSNLLSQLTVQKESSV